MRRRTLLASLAALPLAFPRRAHAASVDPNGGHEAVRGVTVSCPTWGWEWGSDEMVATLDVLSGLGVEWISIHPYARIHGDGRVTYRSLDPGAPPEWLARPVREAHARGMKVMIKPHLAYWGSGFSWRGAIAFDDPAAHATFFSDYAAWILALALASAGADAFVVGTELDRLTGDGPRWRQIVAQVRAVFPGRLTYAANWDAFEQVSFWDVLDTVGVQAYFPIVADLPAVQITASVLDEGWTPWLARLRAVAERTGKPVVFTELGYDCSPEAARTPWDPSSGDRVLGERVQELALDAAFRAMEREPAVVGAFLWKWFPGEMAHGDFRMSEPRLQERIRDAWGSPSPVVGSRAGGNE